MSSATSERSDRHILRQVLLIMSGALVIWLGPNVPDLILGLVVSGVAAHGGHESFEQAREAAKREASSENP
jgi:Co/Zn/Cd efflux system component